jgi:RNA polymerase sigma-70 factor (ECF subfamily)
LDGFEQELVKLAREVSYYLRKNGASREDAEDLAQDALVKILETSQVMPAKAIRAWLYKVAINQFRDLYRRKQRYAEIIEEQMATFEHHVAVFEIDQLEETYVSQTLRLLKPAYTELLLLCYDEALCHEEIAFLLEMKKDTVNTKLYRARQAFRKLYKEVTENDKTGI